MRSELSTAKLFEMRHLATLVLCVALGACATPPLVAPVSSPPVAASSPPIPSPATSQESLMADVLRATTNFAFWPLVPSFMPSDDARAQVGIVQDCGTSPSPCLSYSFETPARDPVLIVLEGPAGCCLDSARPHAARNIDIRPGVQAEHESVQPQFGGPILWWVEDTARGPIYVALSNSRLSEDDLVRIASSMRPLAR
jgi:hypothetical protein